MHYEPKVFEPLGEKIVNYELKTIAYDRKIYSQNSKITNPLTQTINNQFLVVVCISLSSSQSTNYTTGM